MSTDLTPPPSPDLPATSPVGNPLTTLVDEATLTVFKALDPEAYLEKLARTDPRLFFKYVALMVGNARGAANPDNRNQTIVNVMNAIPRSPLDELPEGFRTK